jgi:phage baseplate assembly protein W
MPIEFTVTVDDRVAPAQLGQRDSIDGEDIYLQGDMLENSQNDLLTVVGKNAARQSIIRELPANPGSFARRPEWGAGLSAEVLKSATVAQRDRMISRSKARLHANPRVIATRDVSARAIEDGTELNVRVDVAGGHIDTQLVIKSPGVR